MSWLNFSCLNTFAKSLRLIEFTGMSLLTVLLITLSLGCQRGYNRIPARSVKVEDSSKTKGKTKKTPKESDKTPTEPTSTPSASPAITQKSPTTAQTDSTSVHPSSSKSENLSNPPSESDSSQGDSPSAPDSGTESEKSHLYFSVKNSEITIRRAALGQIFLFETQMSPHEYLKMNSSHSHRKVLFQQRGNFLVLLGENQNENDDSNSEFTTVLTQFSILRQDQNSLVFEFLTGTNALILQSEWSINQDSTRRATETKKLFPIQILASYLDQA